jgi:hypothetical protein
MALHRDDTELSNTCLINQTEGITSDMDNRVKPEEQYDSLIKTFSDPCPDLIYHYTSAEGLRGIIENSEIWLTNVAFVNDKTECLALQDEKDLFIDSDFSCCYVKNEWNKFIRNLYVDNNTYIASFSKDKDESIDQYRAYGTFRIGFEANKLIIRPFNLYQCVYYKEEIKNWILEKENVEECKGYNLNKAWIEGAARRLIYDASRKFKNYHYCREEEVRIIAVSHPSWGLFPNSPGMFKDDPPIYYRGHPIFRLPVPYVKLFIRKTEEKEDRRDDVSKETCMQMKERKRKEEGNTERDLLPIKEVSIGPMVHQKEAQVACEILLKDRGYENVIVNASNIPYRGF